MYAGTAAYLRKHHGALVSPIVCRTAYALVALASVATLVFIAWQVLQLVTALLLQYLLIVFLTVMGPDALIDPTAALDALLR